MRFACWEKPPGPWSLFRRVEGFVAARWVPLLAVYLFPGAASQQEYLALAAGVAAILGTTSPAGFISRVARASPLRRECAGLGAAGVPGGAGGVGSGVRIDEIRFARFHRRGGGFAFRGLVLSAKWKTDDDDRDGGVEPAGDL